MTTSDWTPVYAVFRTLTSDAESPVLMTMLIESRAEAQAIADRLRREQHHEFHLAEFQASPATIASIRAGHGA